MGGNRLMDIEHEVITNAQMATRPAGIPTAEQARAGEFTTRLDEVAEKLDLLGYDPLEALVHTRLTGNLSDQQRAAIDRWVLPFRYPQKKAIELTNGGGPLKIEVVRFADT